jgi:hypothetical protein
MLSFHAHLKVFVATAPCDLRLSFNGLWSAAQHQLGEDPKKRRALCLREPPGKSVGFVRTLERAEGGCHEKVDKVGQRLGQ